MRRGEAMTQEVFGLRYEFVYRHGHYMSLYKEEGLDASALSTLQVRMLEANQVPKLLPLEIQEVDHRVNLLYNLSAKRMLAHVLKVDGLSKQHFAKMMYAIVCALGESKDYMLYETGFVLKDNFIFIGSDWSDVYLTYVPLEAIDEEPTFKSLETLMKQLSMNLKDEEKNMVVTWLESLSRVQSLQGYKENLLALIDEQPPVQEVSLISYHDNEHDLEDRPNVQLPLIKENNLPKPLWNRDELHQSGILNTSIEKLTQSKIMANLNERGQGKPVSFLAISERSHLVVLATVILLSAFLWQHYFIYPSTVTLQITAGISILLINVWFVIRFIGVPRFAKGSNGVKLPFFPVVEKQHEQNQETPTPETPNIQNYYQNLHMHTSLLIHKKPNATVFLGRVINEPLGPRIEAQNESTAKTVPLTNDPFTMGRGDASLKVDYVLEEVGVSRVHAEIVKKEEGYEIKDTGSTNGTYLNGEPLVAYQSYPLKDGDEIRIVRHEMKFRL